MAAVPGCRLVTLYTAWGSTLDPDLLLGRRRPRGRHSVWRRGDMEFGAPAVTAGISIIVATGSSSDAHCRTIKRFLENEAPFLRAVHRALGRRDRSELSTTMHVEHPPPVGVQHDEAVCPRVLAKARCGSRRPVEHACMARGRYGPSVTVEPSNNKMQLTSGGLNGALRAPSSVRRLQLILVFCRHGQRLA